MKFAFLTDNIGVQEFIYVFVMTLWLTHSLEWKILYLFSPYFGGQARNVA